MTEISHALNIIAIHAFANVAFAISVKYTIVRPYCVNLLKKKPTEPKSLNKLFKNEKKKNN